MAPLRRVLARPLPVAARGPLRPARAAARRIARRRRGPVPRPVAGEERVAGGAARVPARRVPPAGRGLFCAGRRRGMVAAAHRAVAARRRRRAVALAGRRVGVRRVLFDGRKGRRHDRAGRRVRHPRRRRDDPRPPVPRRNGPRRPDRQPARPAPPLRRAGPSRGRAAAPAARGRRRGVPLPGLPGARQGDRGQGVHRQEPPRGADGRGVRLFAVLRGVEPRGGGAGVLGHVVGCTFGQPASSAVRQPNPLQPPPRVQRRELGPRRPQKPASGPGRVARPWRAAPGRTAGTVFHLASPAAQPPPRPGVTARRETDRPRTFIWQPRVPPARVPRLRVALPAADHRVRLCAPRHQPRHGLVRHGGQPRCRIVHPRLRALVPRLRRPGSALRPRELRAGQRRDRNRLGDLRLRRLAPLADALPRPYFRCIPALARPAGLPHPARRERAAVQEQDPRAGGGLRHRADRRGDAVHAGGGAVGDTEAAGDRGDDGCGVRGVMKALLGRRSSMSRLHGREQVRQVNRRGPELRHQDGSTRPPTPPTAFRLPRRASMASNASIAPADGPPMPCARCGVPTPPGAARACAHLLEGRLRSFRALPAASAACTLCAPADASFPLCPPCAADLLLRNVALSPGDRERGYALAPRASVLAVLDEGHEARMRPLPGALAKLGLTAVPTREDRWFERLWVAVTAPGRGEVRNEPGVFSPDVLRLGDSVEFAEEHVLRCYAPAEPSKLPKKRRKKPPREAEDGRDAKLLADVASHGFHVVHVEPNDELGIPRFSFTVGLYHTFGHPELLIRAAEMEVGQAVLTLLAESAKSTGEAAVPGGMLLEAECGLVEFPGEMYGDYLGYAGWFYGGWEFPVLELRWQEKVPVAGSDHVSGAKVE